MALIEDFDKLAKDFLKSEDDKQEDTPSLSDKIKNKSSESDVSVEIITSEATNDNNDSPAFTVEIKDDELFLLDIDNTEEIVLIIDDEHLDGDISDSDSVIKDDRLDGIFTLDDQLFNDSHNPEEDGRGDSDDNFTDYLLS